MPSRALLITVRLLDERYHGTGDWPPSPFRLFQALVAGAYGGRWRAEPASRRDAAFEWLERLGPPHIASPAKLEARATTYYVPNNDLDAVGGDPKRVSEIRAGKTVRPILFAPSAPFLYVWPFDEGETHAQRLCGLSERLHTLGRGIDPAFATGEIADWSAAEVRLRGHGGAIARPSNSSSGANGVPCPTQGSLRSLTTRHAALADRFATRQEGTSVTTLFRQPPKALFRSIAYDRPTRRFLFDLRPENGTRTFRPIAQERAAEVAKAVRDLAAHRLVQALPDRVTEIERVVVGRNASELDKPRRIRVVPLPTIGFEHADPAIRRVLFEVPPDCPIAIADLMWSVSGQSICDRVDRGTGEIAEGPILVPAENDRMLRHYGVEGRPARRWRTVTPAVLAERRPRGRIGGAARVSAEREAAAAVADALRNAGIDAAGVEVRVQAEPFHRKGLRAEAFQPDRFDQRMLRHVEVNFPRAVQGPLVIGNGRWLGLGLMAPTAQDVPALHLFLIDPAQAPVADQAEMLTRALRRATMAQAQQRLGRGEHLPTFFTGHEPDGSRACSGRHEHLFFLADDADGDGRIDRLAIVAPHLADRSIASGDQRALRLLEAAIADMTILRAGRAGAPRLIPAPLPDASDAVFGRARSWLSRTWYRPTRHLHRKRDATEALHSDLLGECARRRLPRPEVEVIDILSGPRGGIAGRFRLRFDVAVEGPLLLGAGSHFGAGLFAAEYDGPST